jgi:hypothetical protein
MKPKARTPAFSRTKRNTATATSSPRPGISRRDLRVADRIAQAFGCLPVMPAKSPRN